MYYNTINWDTDPWEMTATATIERDRVRREREMEKMWVEKIQQQQQQQHEELTLPQGQQQYLSIASCPSTIPYWSDSICSAPMLDKKEEEKKQEELDLKGLIAYYYNRNR